MPARRTTWPHRSTAQVPAPRVAVASPGYSLGVQQGSAAPLVPETNSLADLAEAAGRCRACPLYQDTTQSVFGEGPTTASLVLVGEQPGDQEDRKGHPFVG